VLYEYEGLDRCFALILLVLLSRSFIIRHELFLSVLLDAARKTITGALIQLASNILKLVD
jgi:hypothetical protein